ncbi:PucR family transcriptional regulator [Clostridiales bacterium TF09-2AC]|nr:PucR family transcriptional regulator [Clostridiales bacterium TF09-2AC]
MAHHIDKHYNTGLMSTLNQYLLYTRNITKVAAILNIHRNTLLYRLNRIKEITNLNLENGDEYIKMMLHIKIKEYITFRESAIIFHKEPPYTL